MSADLNGDFLARMAAEQASFSPKMARLAVFLSDEYVQAAFMTTREIAAAAGVSLATVVRFPAVLGYADFEAFRASIQDRVHFDLTAVERMRSLPETARSPAAFLTRVIDAEIASLDTLARTFSEAEVARFVQALRDATGVTIIGFRFASPLALYFSHALSRIKANVHHAIQGDSYLYDQISLMENGHLLVALSFARYARDQQALIRYAHSLGRRIVVITDNPLSPAVPMAEVILYAKVSLLDFVGSLGAPAALINCIVSELGVLMGEEALARLQALEVTAESAGTFIKSGRGTPAAHASS